MIFTNLPVNLKPGKSSTLLVVKANLEVRPHFCTKDRPASRTSKLFWPPQPNRTQSTLQYGNPCNCTLTKSYLTWLTLHYKFRVLCLNSSFPLPLSVFPNPSPCINIPRSVARLFVNKVTKLWQKLNLGFLKLNCVVNTLISPYRELPSNLCQS